MCAQELDRFPLLYESYSPATKKVIIEALQAGIFGYQLLDIIDANGVVRNKFAPGETVYCHIIVSNYGYAPDKATIVVTDLDTGAEIKKLITDIVALEAFFEFSKVDLGTMPNRDWKLRFALTP